MKFKTNDIQRMATEEAVRILMEASYNGYKAYSERCYKRYNNVIDYRHGDDYFMNEIAKEAFGK